jgi:hypothetical protein
MLYGCQNIHVYTDHKNNTFQRLQTQWGMRWWLFLEDYGVQFHYIKGESNSLTDALSHLPFNERQNTMETSVMVASDSFFLMMIDDDDLLDCFVKYFCRQEYWIKRFNGIILRLVTLDKIVCTIRCLSDFIIQIYELRLKM